MTNILENHLERPLLVGPDHLKKPYPVHLQGQVIKGFGRGSRELGIPTANFATEVVSAACSELENGIYFGWAQVRHRTSAVSSDVYPMVMSLGWNPFYKNVHRSAEVHIIHTFDNDFYGDELRVLVAGYIRPEKNYEGVQALIEDINFDIKAGVHSLQRDAYTALKQKEVFTK